VAAFLGKVSSSYSRLEMTAWFLMTPAVLIASRLAVRAVLRSLRAAGKNIRAAAVAGAGPMAASIMKHLEEPATFGVRLIGVFDDRSSERIRADGHDASRCVGKLSDLLIKATRGEVDYVFIALPMRAEKRIIELVSQLADTTVSVYVVPDLFVFDLMRARSVTVGGLPAVSVYESPFDGISGALTRAEDVFLGALFLLVAAMPMALIAIGVKLTSRGSVLFKQKRYGLNGRVLEVWKFRTMNASDDGAVVPQASSDDARVTAFGRILRSTSFDELPQLFNVLSGDMSLVGPRPHAVAHNEEYRRLVHGYMLRHKVKPGITGWAQVNGWRGQTDTLDKMQRRVDHDLEYLQNWSVWLDLKILFLTVAAVFTKKNAY
jgi:putative colanic acid biosynthesis UDP-glucose lipid carrier transferase